MTYTAAMVDEILVDLAEARAYLFGTQFSTDPDEQAKLIVSAKATVGVAYGKLGLLEL